MGANVYSRLAEKHSSPAVNFTRSLVALPLFCVTLFLFGGAAAFEQLAELSLRQWLWFAASILGSFALGDTLFFLSIHALGVPVAMAIAATFPIWAALAGWVFLGDAFHASMALGVVLVVSGTAIVILGEYRAAKGRPAAPRKYWVGVILAFTTSLFWALNSFGLAIASEGLDPVFTNIIRAALSILLCPLIGVLVFRQAFRPIPFRQARGYLWVFALEAFGGSMLYVYGINHSPLATAAALSSLTPVVVLCLGWISGKGRVSAQTSFAICLVVLGIWLLVAVRP